MEQGSRAPSLIYDIFGVLSNVRRGCLTSQSRDGRRRVFGVAQCGDFPPPYKPYVTPDYTGHPWLRRMPSQVNSLNKWRTRVTRPRGINRYRSRRGIVAKPATLSQRTYVAIGALSAAWPPICPISRLPSRWRRPQTALTPRCIARSWRAISRTAIGRVYRWDADPTYRKLRMTLARWLLAKRQISLTPNANRPPARRRFRHASRK